MSDTPTGRPCWYELMSTDPAATHDFYGAVVGWSAAPWEGGEMPYTVWMNGEAAIGGLMQLPPEIAERGAPSHWLMYVSTPDVEATGTKAAELGAEVLNTLDIPEVGRIAIIRDPQGAVFAAYQPATYTPGHDGERQVGEFSWHELLTSDRDAAFAFYSRLFGWSKTGDFDMGAMGTYQMWGNGGPPLGGMMNRPPEMPVTAWLLYARVPDVPAALDKVREMGGTVLFDPVQVPGGDWVAQCLDPTGAAFAVHGIAG